MATKTKTRKKVQTSTKKPSWSVTSYKKIEARRTELGYSKSAMAKALGVTNSTYHNWRRGTTIPHPTQQEAIAALLVTLAPMTRGSNKTKAPQTPSKGSKGRPRVKGTTRRSASEGSKAPRTDVRATGDVGMKPTSQRRDSAQTHPLYPAAPETVRGIAQITAAYISAQKSAPSAGSVYKFVRGLRSELEGNQEG